MSLGPHATESVFGLTATSFRRLACVTGSRLEKHRSLTPLPSLSFHHSLLVPPDMPFLLSSARCELVCRVTLGPLDGRGPAASSSVPSPFPTAASGMSTYNSQGRESPAPENRDRQDLPSPAPGIPKLSKAQIPANRPSAVGLQTPAFAGSHVPFSSPLVPGGDPTEGPASLLGFPLQSYSGSRRLPKGSRVSRRWLTVPQTARTSVKCQVFKKFCQPPC